MSEDKREKRIFRLQRRDPVKFANWYYRIACRNCHGMIYLLDDPSGGNGPPLALLGAAPISTCCPRCGEEGVYSPEHVNLGQADEDLPGSRPPRISTSASPRQPLAAKYPNVKATFGVALIEDRPIAASIVARIITGWADVEVQTARLLGQVMGTNTPSVAAVFASLRSSRVQQDALDAAAEASLSPDDYLLFAAHMTRKATLERERNDLTHGCFGTSPALPNLILWISQADRIQHQAIFQTDGLEAASEWLKRRTFMYEFGTLERIAQEIEELNTQLGFLIGYLTMVERGAQQAVSRYQELAKQAHIAEAMARLQAKAKKG